MGIIKAKNLVHEFIRRDEEGNVESINTALDHVNLDVKHRQRGRRGCRIWTGKYRRANGRNLGESQSQPGSRGHDKIPTSFAE